MNSSFRQQNKSYSRQAFNKATQKPVNTQTHIRCCFVGDAAAATWAGRSFRELLLGIRGIELPISIKNSPAYGHRADLPLPRLITKISRRPPSGRIRLMIAPASALPSKIDRGVYWALTNFDPIQPTNIELDALRAPSMVLLPTELHRKQALTAGIPAEKLAVIPVGVNKRVFRHKAASINSNPYIPNDKEAFIFITVTSPLQRKGLDLLLRAYLEEFSGSESVLLIIKLAHKAKPRKKFPYEIPGLSQRFGALKHLPARVLVIDDALEDKNLAALLASSDAYVCANRSFHTALSVREAMACGCPIIGPSTLQSLLGIDETSSFLVPTVPFEAPSSFLFSGSPKITLQEPDIKLLRQRMREAFSNPAATKAKGRKAAQHAKSFSDWREASRLLAENLHQFEVLSNNSR